MYFSLFIHKSASNLNLDLRMASEQKQIWEIKYHDFSLFAKL